MKIRVLSDLHLEFGYMHMAPSNGEKVLVLAGDVGVVKKPSYLKLVKEWAEMFEHVIYVPGNHEYYKGSIDVAFEHLTNWAADTNIHVLNNKLVIIDDVAFLGSTMWTNLSNPIAALHADDRMNDFRSIRTNQYARKFRAADAYEEFSKATSYLTSALSRVQSHKIVVVTHHAPSFQSVGEQYKGDLLNDAFASDLEWMMEAYEPDVWIHGHMHHSLDYMVGKTRVVCNPRGYMGHEMNPDFDKTKVIEV